jgi:hypothetical protein
MKLPKNTKTTQTKPKKVIFSIIGLVVIALGGWWAYVNFAPHPLGDKLEYLGKENLGGGLFFYDYKPYSVYYYGTDMNVDEVEKYFKNANITSPAMDRSEYIDITLKNQRTSKLIHMSYYEDAEKIRTSNLTNSDRKHIIKINSEDYNAAKDSL